MLVIERCINDRIFIGDGPDRIEIMVCGVRPLKGSHAVRIGINASRSIPVYRPEVLARKRKSVTE